MDEDDSAQVSIDMEESMEMSSETSEWLAKSGIDGGRGRTSDSDVSIVQSFPAATPENLKK